MNANELYQSIMKWLESGIGPTGSTRQLLKIEADGRTLAFRRIDMLGGRVDAEYVKDPRVRIAYDPNWNALLKIEGILADKD